MKNQNAMLEKNLLAYVNRNIDSTCEDLEGAMRKLRMIKQAVPLTKKQDKKMMKCISRITNTMADLTEHIQMREKSI
jgi:hypothetical protein